jgi:hypothetical protein
MAYRKLPFGYQMRQGKIEEHPAEAETLRWIFQYYLAGNSYQKVMDELLRQDVPYLLGRPWNKNMVARVLADRRYAGADGYPQLIDPARFQAVQKTVPCRTAPLKRDEERAAMQWFAICAVCGERVLRDSKQHGRERWQCPQCKAISTKATDRKLIAGTKELLDGLIQAPDIVSCAGRESEESCSIQRAEDAFQQAMDTPNFSESATKTAALSLAAARFDALGSEDYESMRIQYILARAEQNGKLNTMLLRQITSAILIHPDGTVSLKLKNGQIIERSDFS